MATVESLIPETVRCLAEIARKRTLAAYCEVAESIGTHHRVVAQVLWHIHDNCVDNGWPPLTAVVVRKGKRKPGEGYLEELAGRHVESAQEAMWQRDLEVVYDFDWDSLLASPTVRARAYAANPGRRARRRKGNRSPLSLK